MPAYTYADVTLASSFPLGEILSLGENRLGGYKFEVRLLDRPPPEPIGANWIHQWRTGDGHLTLSLARSDGGFLLRFPESMDFSISSDAKRIGAWSPTQIDDETLRHFLLDQVLPRLLGHLGRLVLHASSVELDGRAIAFAGETGRGKSTMAASLHATGWPLLGDDGLIVDKEGDLLFAIPTYRGLRLWPPSVDATVDGALPLAPMSLSTDKRRLEVPPEGGRSTLPLAALFVLGPPPSGNDEGVGVTQLSARDGCIALIRHAFQLDVSDQDRAARVLAVAADVAERLPVFELEYPRDYGRLASVHLAVRDCLDSCAGSIRETGRKR